MERVDQPSTGGEYSGDASASASASWENFEESPPLPFPPRVPEFSRNTFREERFAGMNNDGSLMNNEGSSVMRDDAKSCFVASTAFSFFVVLTMAFGLYASETLRLGPNASILIKPNHLFVEYIKVETLNAAKGSMLYGFYKDPPLDAMLTWSETHKITLPSSTHKEWVYYLNEGSQVNISYSVNSLSSSPLVLVIVEEVGIESMQMCPDDRCEGNTGLAEWLKDPSYPNITLSWNIIHGNGSIQKDVSDSSTYYIAVGNLNDEFAEASVPQMKAFLYNTTESYYKCTPAEGECIFQLFFSGGNAAVLTSPGRMPGIVGGDWYVKVSYGPRWVTYLFGTGGMTFLLLLINYIMNHFHRTEQDTPRDQLGDIGSERSSLLAQHKDDDIPSWGSSYASISEDEEHKEDAQAGVVQGGKPVKDDENRQLCAICFDAPKNCFFIPCGHCVACFGCATRIVEGFGVCPICRRYTKKDMGISGREWPRVVFIFPLHWLLPFLSEELSHGVDD
ncbi:hypothetical protein DH2020_045955 [Rehmannia glutinosa]|uniref:RING-type domain-containing protein n=1 Tax=Rehmannia glutinosa TaxID=99300 RepID=A0ABR0UCL6_REHGL